MTAPTETSRPLTWLITGTSSGFGLSLARHVLSQGHTVIATSRNPSRTPDLVAEVESHPGSRWITLDVTSLTTPSIIASLEEGKDEEGQGEGNGAGKGTHIDVLVNNAGYSVFAPCETTTEDEYRGLMETLFFGPARLMRAVVPYMRKRGSGTIVNISSGAALEGNESMGPYAGAKAGLDGLTRVFAKEVAPFNIRCLTVVAGTFNTSFGTNAVFGAKPLPDEYKGSMTETVINAIKSGQVKPNSDKEKGMRALYEVVVGDGAGAGRGAERMLLLGRDMDARARKLMEYYGHALEVFGQVTNGVALDTQ